jgi:hypothetical protein
MRLGPTDLAAEVTRSVDATPGGGGGPAAFVRATTGFAGQEIEISARAYAASFVNPYARPIAAADELDGQRARDETGGRLSYAGRLAAWLAARAMIDVWTHPSGDDSVEAVAAGRVDARVGHGLGLGLAADWRGGSPRLAARARLEASRALVVTSEIVRGADQRVAWLAASLRAGEPLRLRARTRWQEASQASSWASDLFLDWEFWRRGDSMRIRYDVLVELNPGSRDMPRGPQHAVWLELETQF